MLTFSDSNVPGAFQYMKMTIEIDCTPQEARTLMGLPDLEPLQTAVLAQIEKRMLDAASGMSAEKMLKTWFSLVPGSDQYLKTMAGFAKATRGADSRDGGGDPR